MKLPFVVRVLIFLGCISCSSSEHKDGEGAYDVQMSLEPCLNISADYTYNYENYTGWSMSSFNGENYLTSTSSGVVFTFGISTGEISFRDELVKQGPLSMGGLSKFDGIVRVDANELLIAKNESNQVYLVNQDSARIVADFSYSGDIRLASNFVNPPVEANDFYLFPFYPNRKEKIGNSNAFVALSKDYKKQIEVIDVSPAYRGRFYGTTPYFYFPSVAYNSNKNTYLVSFPISHDVYEYNEKFILINTYKFFHEEVGEIQPYSKPLDEEGNPDFDEDVAYYRSTNHFLNIYYLPKSDQYVRIARVFSPEDEIGKFIMIVYDGTFSKSKHFKLSDDYFAFSSFVTDDHIYFLNQSRYSSDRNTELPFDCISFEEN